MHMIFYFMHAIFYNMIFYEINCLDMDKERN